MKPRAMQSIWFQVAGAVILTAVAGCGPDFEPASYLNDPRVLAIEADPLEAGQGDQVSLRPVIFVPPEQEIASESWTCCPFSLGPSAGYRCAAPDCQGSLVPEEDGRVVSRPFDLALDCAEELAAGGDLPDGVPAETPGEIEVIYTYVLRTSVGVERTAVARIPLWLDEPPARNRPPRIVRVELGGVQAASGDTLDPVAEGDALSVRVQIDPDSMDDFVDEAGRQRTEEPIVSFFATAGRFEADRTNGLDTTLEWEAKKLEPGQTSASVYLVVRDLRGGQTVFGPVVVPILL